MVIFRKSAITSLCLVTAFMTSGCGRDGLSSNGIPGAASVGGVTVRRVFHLPNNLPDQWAAYREGAGPWIPIQPIEKGGNEYQFVVTSRSEELGFAVAANMGQTHSEVCVTFLTGADCLDGVELDLSGPRKAQPTQRGTISWSVTGLAANEEATVSPAGWNFDVPQNGSGYSPDTDWPASGDLLVTAGPAGGLATHMIIRRNLRLAPGTTLAPIDLHGAEAFPLQTAQIALAHLPVADQGQTGVGLTTIGGSIPLSAGINSGDMVPFAALPSERLAPGDLYIVNHYSDSAAGTVDVTSYFRSPNGQQLTIPAIPSGAQVWNAGDPGDVRLTAEWPGTEPGSARFADYSQGPDLPNTRWWHLTVSPSYAATEVGPVTVPDLRDVAGWNSQWDLSVGVATTWTVGSQSSSSMGASPRDGTIETTTAQLGTITP
jgi:hypothetical protein